MKGRSKSVSAKGKTAAPTPLVVKIPENVVIESVPPQGRENCLDGYKIAFTGVMGEFLSRPDLEALVLQYGGKVAQSISGKTTFLVASPTLEDGRDSTSSMKYRTAVDKKVKIVTEKDFLGLIQASISNPVPNQGEAGGASMSRSFSTSNVSRVVKALVPQLPRASSSSSSSPLTSELLWVDKYKPKRLEDVIGAAESIRKILDWLKKWPDIHIRKTVKVIPSYSLRPS
jgi:replication factor C subunit 1